MSGAPGRPGAGGLGIAGWLVGGTLYAGLLIAMVSVPYQVPVDPTVASASAAAGYNTAAAHLVASGWILLTLVVFGLWGRWGKSQDAAFRPSPEGASSGRRPPAWPEVAFWSAVGFAVHFPWFLRRAGPFVEDPVFIGMLHRMHGGLRPFVGFEFLYGPLMAHAAHGWIELTGFSLLGYYGYVALLEAVLYGTLALLLHRWIPDRRARWVSMLLLLALVANSLVAPNWSSTRRLLGFLALVITAANPRSTRAASIAGLLVGLQATYSHDFGVAAAAGLIAIQSIAALHAGPLGWAASAGRLLVAGTLALATWTLVCLGLQGVDGFAAQIRELLYLSSRFGAGEAGFEFYWTLNSLALFALLLAAATAVGLGLARARNEDPDLGDLLLVGGLAFVVVGLKSGLNRSDLFHLNAPLLPLAVAVLLRHRRRLFRLPITGERVALAALVVTVSTYVFGGLPGASILAQGWVTGLRSALSAPPTVLAIETRAPSVLHGLAAPDPRLVSIARFLAAPEWAGRPVVFYQRSWPLPMFVGVYREEYINDKFLYSDERGQLVRAHLEERPDALVVMARTQYEALFGIGDDEVVTYPLTVAKSLARWLSTVHYRGRETEQRVRDARWRRGVGDWIAERYRLAGELDKWVVLEPRP